MFKKLFYISILFFCLPLLAKKSDKVQVAFFIGGSLLNQSSTPVALFDGTFVQSGKLVSTYEDTISGGIEVRYLPEDDWLFKVGVRTMPYRKAIRAELQISGSPTQILPMSPYSYRLTSIYYDAGYCWESFYMFIGLSYNIFDFSSPGSTMPYRTKNGIGSNVGLGFKVSDDFSIEYAGHSANVSLESGPLYQDTDEFVFTDAVLSLRFGF